MRLITMVAIKLRRSTATPNVVAQGFLGRVHRGNCPACCKQRAGTNGCEIVPDIVQK